MRMKEDGNSRDPVQEATMVKTNGGSGTIGTADAERVTEGQEVGQDRMSQGHAVNQFQ